MNTGVHQHARVSQNFFSLRLIMRNAQGDLAREREENEKKIFSINMCVSFGRKTEQKETA